MVNQNWHVAPVMPLCQATASYSKIFRPENCRNPTTLLHWHESHFNSESRKWNNFCCLNKILTLELQHKHPWTTLIEHSLFFFVGESENEKCKSQKTAVLDGTPFENWSYYRLRMTKWVNILIKWQDLIKTWESVLRVSHTERQRVGRASCAHQTLITRHLTDYTFVILRNHIWHWSQVLVSSFSSCSEDHPLLPPSIASVSGRLPY